MSLPTGWSLETTVTIGGDGSASIIYVILNSSGEVIGNGSHAVPSGSAGANITPTLGLTTGTGTLYSGTAGGQAVSTSHQTTAELGALLRAWAAQRVEDDKF